MCNIAQKGRGSCWHIPLLLQAGRSETYDMNVKFETFLGEKRGKWGLTETRTETSAKSAKTRAFPSASRNG